MPLEPSHPDFWTEALQFTPTVHRDVYPAISPANETIKSFATGKVVLITGAGSGFGKGACLQWAKSGASAIIVVGRRLEQLERTIETVSSAAPKTRFLAISSDVSNVQEVQKTFQQAITQFSKIDVCVHSAGVLGPLSNICDTIVDEWWASFEINAKGTFLVAQKFASLAKQQGYGTFINTGTAAAYFASPGQSSYTMSKCVGNMLIDQLTAENACLRVFNVHPGMAKSSVLRSELEVYAKDTIELFGSLTVYLSGNHADFLRGRFVAANWDVKDLEKYSQQIVEHGLLKNQFVKGSFGSGGHKF